MNKTKIKICGLTRAEDILVLRELDVDFSGFVFVPESPRYIEPGAAVKIMALVPPGIARVAIFADTEARVVEKVIRTVHPDILQFHGHEAPDYCQQFGLPYFKAILVKKAINFHYLSLYNPEAFLLDTFSAKTFGGTGKTFNWDLAVEAEKQPAPVILAGGLNPENVFQAVIKARPWGVDVSSGVETNPGVKDHGKMKAFVKAVRKAEKEIISNPGPVGRVSKPAGLITKFQDTPTLSGQANTKQ